MFNLKRTITLFNPYETFKQSHNRLLLNRKCLHEKVKQLQPFLKKLQPTVLSERKHLHDACEFRAWWKYYAENRQDPTRFERREKIKANTTFWRNIKDEKASKFFQIMLEPVQPLKKGHCGSQHLSEQRSMQAQTYGHIYEEFKSCFVRPTPIENKSRRGLRRNKIRKMAKTTDKLTVGSEKLLKVTDLQRSPSGITKKKFTKPSSEVSLKPQKKTSLITDIADKQESQQKVTITKSVDETKATEPPKEPQLVSEDSLSLGGASDVYKASETQSKILSLDKINQDEKAVEKPKDLQHKSADAVKQKEAKEGKTVAQNIAGDSTSVDTFVAGLSEHPPGLSQGDDKHGSEPNKVNLKNIEVKLYRASSTNDIPLRSNVAPSESSSVSGSFSFRPSESGFTPSTYIFGDFNIARYIQEYLRTHANDFEITRRTPLNWPSPIKKPKRLLRATTSATKTKQLKRRKRIKRRPKCRSKDIAICQTEPESQTDRQSAASCEICESLYCHTEPDESYMADMLKSRAREELKEYYRQHCRARQRTTVRSPSVITIPNWSCTSFHTTPELQVGNMRCQLERCYNVLCHCDRLIEGRIRKRKLPKHCL